MNSDQLQIKLNPNGLPFFKKLFLQYKSALSSEPFYLHCQFDPSKLLFISYPLENSRNLSYFLLSDDLFIEDIQTTRSHFMLKLSDSTFFTKFLRLFSEKSSSFSLTFIENVLTLLYSEGSELRTRTLEASIADAGALSDVFPFVSLFMGNIPTKELLKFSEIVNRTDGGLVIDLMLEESKLDLKLEVKMPFEMKVEIFEIKVEIFSERCKEKMEFRFVLDKSRAKILMIVSNFGEIAGIGVSEDKRLFMMYRKENEKGELVYEMGFMIPFLEDFEDKKMKEEEKNEDEEEKNEDEKKSHLKKGEIKEEEEEDEEESFNLFKKSNMY